MNNDLFSELISQPIQNEIDRTKSPALINQFVFNDIELNQKSGLIDPIGDQAYAKVPGLIHRYTNRALFIPTEKCPIHCRYCFRKNELASENDFLKNDFDQVLRYLTDHPEINELIFTGGDPLMLSNEKIKFYLEHFAKIASLKFIRFHTRTPIALPKRINQEFTNLLKAFQQRFIIHLVIHTNHLSEWTDDFYIALKRLNQSHIPMLGQTVLLKEVNDDFQSLKELFENMALYQIRPYYLHHPDQVKGAMHFYLPLKKGREIYSKLRNCLPGWALPNYIIDIPGGAGKTPAYNPESFDFSGKLINRTGQLIAVNPPIL